MENTNELDFTTEVMHDAAKAAAVGIASTLGMLLVYGAVVGVMTVAEKIKNRKQPKTEITTTD